MTTVRERRTKDAAMPLGVPAGIRRPSVRTFVVVFLLGVLPLALLGWVAVRGALAREHLLQARGQLAGVRSAVLAGRSGVADASARLRRLQLHTAAAQALVSDPVWRASERLPWVGQSTGAVRAVAEVTDRLARDAAPALAAAAAQIDPATLIHGASVDVAALVRARPDVLRGDAATRVAVERLRSQPTEHLPGPLRRGLSRLLTELAGAERASAAAARVVTTLPPLLGADGPRRYFLAVQNNAEARGTGGLLGAYGVLRAEGGRVQVLRLGPNSDLRDLPVTGRLERARLDLGLDFESLYGSDAAMWSNSNASPHHPFAARRWLELWRRQTGQRLDGVVTADPVALGYVLRATGPAVLPDGARLDADNAASMTMSELYSRFPAANQVPRDAYLQEVARAALGKVLAGGVSSGELARALSRAVTQRRLLVYSTRSGEQAALARSGLAGELPDRSGPFAAVVVNNAGGNKLDYYLDRSLDYRFGGCRSPTTRRSTITVRLGNAAAPAGLPAYVALGADRFLLAHPGPTRPGTSRLFVQVYAALGAQLLGATRDGKPVAISPDQERGHPVYVLTLETPPAGSTVLVFQLLEPASTAQPATIVQPLVRAQHTRLPEPVACPGS